MSPRRRLYRHPHSGIYYARIQRNGVKRTFSLGRNERRALRALQRIEEDIASGKIVFGEVESTRTLRPDGFRDVHVKELVVAHLQWAKDNTAEGTFRLRQHYLLRLLDFVGDAMVSSITSETMSEFHQDCRRRFSKGAGGGAEPVRHVKTMFRWAAENNVCDSNVRKWPKPKRADPGTKALRREELERLIPSLSEDFRPIVLFGLLTGLRPQELRGLRREHLEWNGEHSCYVRIEHHKTSNVSRAHRPRTVPLCAEAVRIVRRQAETHPESDHVFLDGHGKPYTKNGLGQRLRRACLRAGVEPRSPYSLRHTFGTFEAGARTNQSILAQLMGHSNVHTTDRYVANVDAAHVSAVAAMEGCLKGLLAQGEGDSPRVDGDGKIIPFPDGADEAEDAGR